MKTSATTRKGVPCRGSAVRGSDPPRCFAHIDRRAERAPLAEELPQRLPAVDRRSHAEIIEDHLSELARKQAALGALIDRDYTDPESIADLKRMCRLMTLYFRLAHTENRLRGQIADWKAADRPSGAEGESLRQ